MSEYWTETTNEDIAKQKIIIGGHLSEVEFTRDNNDDIEILEAYLNFKPSDNVLDFGCGIGRLMKPLFNEYHFNQIWGYDIAPLHLKMGKEYFPEGNFTDKKPTVTFDRIYSTLVMQHIEKAEAVLALRDMYALLNLGGEMMIQFPNLLEQNKSDILNVFAYEVAGLVNKKNSNAPLMRFYTQSELSYYAQVLGFEYCVVHDKRKDRIWLYVVKK